MHTVRFGNSEVEVADVADTLAAARVLEFRDIPADTPFASVIIPDGGDWSSALLSINPQAGAVSASLVACVLEYARTLVAE